MPLHYSLKGRVHIPTNDYFMIWLDSQGSEPGVLIVMPAWEIVSQEYTR